MAETKRAGSSSTKRRRSPAKKAEPAPAVLSLPSAEDIEEARRRRKEAQQRSTVAPSTVFGLPDGWVSAVVESTMSPGRIERIRQTWKAKGWTELDGLHAVAGYNEKAIVFVKTREDYEQARRERDQRIAALRKSGQMH